MIIININYYNRYYCFIIIIIIRLLFLCVTELVPQKPQAQTKK